jgi:hypothetical protein
MYRWKSTSYNATLGSGNAEDKYNKLSSKKVTIKKNEDNTCNKELFA